MLRHAITLLVFALTSSLFAVVQRESPLPYAKTQQVKRSAERLESIVIERNGARQLVAPGAELRFVRGDKLKIREAILSRHSLKASRINLVGFTHAKSADDRNITIDTSKELSEPTWALSKQKSTYAVAVLYKEKLSGLVYLRRIDPQLSYLDVRVNAKPLVLREGSVLKVTAQDKFQIERIVTNLDSHENVKFHIREAPEGEGRYQILISHRDYIFAQLAMQVTGEE